MKNARKTFRTNLAIATAVFSVFLIFLAEAQGKDAEKGVVSSIRGGKLERLESNRWKGLVSGQDVLQGDRLRTDKTAVAIVEFPSVGKFVIGPSSDIEMGKEPKDFDTKMNRGALWLKSTLPKGNKAAISTTLATAGVRGTAFSMVFGEGEKAVCACTCSGEVEVTLKNGKSIRVPKAEYVAIASDAPAPEKSQTSLPVLEKTGTVFDFCLNCHLVGRKGKLKPEWE